MTKDQWAAMNRMAVDTSATSPMARKMAIGTVRGPMLTIHSSMAMITKTKIKIMVTAARIMAITCTAAMLTIVMMLLTEH